MQELYSCKWVTCLVLVGLVSFFGKSLHVNANLDSFTRSCLRDDALDRWMANYLAIKDFECRIVRHAVHRNASNLAKLLEAKPTIDSRGYYRLGETFLKYRPKDRLYLADDRFQSVGERGRWGNIIFSFDGVSYKTFDTDSYSGAVLAEESFTIRGLINPMHFISYDDDLEALYNRGLVTKESDLVYTATVKPSQSLRPRLVKFFLSPEHGYMPNKLEVYTLDGEFEIELRVDEFLKTNGLWFPVRGTLLAKYDGDDLTLFEIDEETLRVNQGFQPKDFSFEFPPGSGYANAVTGEAVQGEEYLRRTLEQAGVRPKLVPPVTTNWFLWAALGLLVVFVPLYFWRRFAGSALILMLLLPVGCEAQKNDHLSGFKLTTPMATQFVLIEPATIEDLVFADTSGEFEREFTVRNTTPNSVHIASLESSCGCMAVTIDNEVIPPLGETKLRLKAEIRDGITDQYLGARFEVTSGDVSQTSAVSWSIKRSSNWRPFQTRIAMNAVVGKSEVLGPLYFEISDHISSPEIKIVDEDGIFTLAEDIKVLEDASKNRRLELKLSAIPTRIERNRDYLIRVYMTGGEPAYFPLVCDLNVLPKVYFENSVARLEGGDNELVLHSIAEPNELTAKVDPANYDVSWRWDPRDQVVRMLLRDHQNSNNSDVSELTVTILVNGEHLSASCKLVPAS